MTTPHASARSTRPSLRLTELPGQYAVARLPAGEGIPHWAVRSPALAAITRTAHETSVICAQERVPDTVRAERGFAALTVDGPLDFSAVGILAALTTPLADAGIPILALSTFDTDVVLIRQEQLAAAIAALSAVGIEVARRV